MANKYSKAAVQTYTPMDLTPYANLLTQKQGKYDAALGALDELKLNALNLNEGFLTQGMAPQVAQKYVPGIDEAVQELMTSKNYKGAAERVKEIHQNFQTDPNVKALAFDFENMANVKNLQAANPGGWFGFTQDNKASGKAIPLELDQLNPVNLANTYGKFLKGQQTYVDYKPYMDDIKDYKIFMQNLVEENGVIRDTQTQLTYRSIDEALKPSAMLTTTSGRNLRAALISRFEDNDTQTANYWNGLVSNGVMTYEEAQQGFLEDIIKTFKPTDYMEEKTVTGLSNAPDGGKSKKGEEEEPVIEMFAKTKSTKEVLQAVPYDWQAKIREGALEKQYKEGGMVTQIDAAGNKTVVFDAEVADRNFPTSSKLEFNKIKHAKLLESIWESINPEDKKALEEIDKKMSERQAVLSEATNIKSNTSKGTSSLVANPERITSSNPRYYDISEDEVLVGLQKEKNKIEERKAAWRNAQSLQDQGTLYTFDAAGSKIAQANFDAYMSYETFDSIFKDFDIYPGEPGGERYGKRYESSSDVREGLVDLKKLTFAGYVDNQLGAPGIIWKNENGKEFMAVPSSTNTGRYTPLLRALSKAVNSSTAKEIAQVREQAGWQSSSGAAYYLPTGEDIHHALDWDIATHKMVNKVWEKPGEDLRPSLGSANIRVVNPEIDTNKSIQAKVNYVGDKSGTHQTYILSNGGKEVSLDKLPLGVMTDPSLVQNIRESIYYGNTPLLGNLDVANAISDAYNTGTLTKELLGNLLSQHGVDLGTVPLQFKDFTHGMKFLATPGGSDAGGKVTTLATGSPDEGATTSSETPSKPVPTTVGGTWNPAPTPKPTSSTTTPVDLAPNSDSSISTGLDIIDSLKKYEGFSSKAYADPVKGTNIGYGYQLTGSRETIAKKDLTVLGYDYAKVLSGEVVISKQDAEILLEKDVDRSKTAAEKLVDNYADLPTKVQEGLTQMVYQMGSGAVSKFEKTLKLLDEGKFEEAAIQARNSAWARQTPERAETVIQQISDAQNTTASNEEVLNEAQNTIKAFQNSPTELKSGFKDNIENLKNAVAKGKLKSSNPLLQKILSDYNQLLLPGTTESSLTKDSLKLELPKFNLEGNQLLVETLAERADCTYALGSKGNNLSIDCSGLVTDYLKKVGVKDIPDATSEGIWRNSQNKQQFSNWKEVINKSYPTGTIIAFDTGEQGFDAGRKNGIDHVGMLISDRAGKVWIAESASGKGGVALTPLEVRLQELDSVLKKVFIGEYLEGTLEETKE